MVRRLATSGAYRTTAFLFAVLLFLLSGPWLRPLPGDVAAVALTYERLGPGDGWQCLSGGSIHYVSGQAAAHRAMLADAPEAAAVQLAGPGFVAEAVEVRPAAGVAIVQGQTPDGAGGWRSRSVLLHASTQLTTEVDLPWGDVGAGCEGLGAWRLGAPN